MSIKEENLSQRRHETNTVKPHFVTTSIDRPPQFKDHLFWTCYQYFNPTKSLPQYENHSVVQKVVLVLSFSWISHSGKYFLFLKKINIIKWKLMIPYHCNQNVYRLIHSTDAELYDLWSVTNIDISAISVHTNKTSDNLQDYWKQIMEDKIIQYFYANRYWLAFLKTQSKPIKSFSTIYMHE